MQVLSALSLARELTAQAIQALATAINGKLAALGQATMAGSMPVALASDQPPVPVEATLAVEPVNAGGIESLPVRDVTTNELLRDVLRELRKLNAQMETVTDEEIRDG